jgi:curved DNA-binding protein
MTHYDTLGVSDSASHDEIKRAYRRLANQHHPDKGGDTTRFQQIQSAYETLIDNDRRAQYDAERRGMGGFKFTVNGHDMGGGMPHEMEEMLRNFGFGFSFGQGFANGDPFAHMRHPRKNKDLQIDITVELQSTLEPQTKIISVQTTNNDRFEVSVNIPRGVRSNTTIKYPNLGDNFFATLPRGDLYVRINVENNSSFLVEGIDLVKNIDLDCIDAILGTTLEVVTLDNKTLSVQIPNGIQHNGKLRLPNHGLYVMNQNSRGSLIICVNICVPTNLTENQLNLLRNLHHNQ